MIYLGWLIYMGGLHISEEKPWRMSGVDDRGGRVAGEGVGEELGGGKILVGM